MFERKKITPLLEALIDDNSTYKFPFESISKELLNMFLNQEEFDYFSIQAYRKLKREFGNVLAHIFLTTMELKLNLKERDVHQMTLEEYQESIEALISSLEVLYITRIEKKSPDGEIMTALI